MFLRVFLVAIASLLLFTSFLNPGSQPKRKAVHSQPKGKIYIIVDKSDYELSVYDEIGWYATYPVVFGSKNLDDKFVEGDKRTPEGRFKIVARKDGHKWNKMFLLDYPTQESRQKFEDRKARGLISKSAKIGGGIGIHGTWPNDDIVVDDYTNWTNGCVSMRNRDLDAMAAYLEIGTTVIIRR